MLGLRGGEGWWGHDGGREKGFNAEAACTRTTLSRCFFAGGETEGSKWSQEEFIYA